MLTDDGIKSQLACNDDDLEQFGRNAEKPLRMELFGQEQRRERGRALAQEHDVVDGGRLGGDRLLRRLRQNDSVLRSLHRELVDDVNAKTPITPVAEWLVDNFYIVEEQISLALRHLPKKYLMELPRVCDDVPRVYDLAEHIIAYGDSRVDIKDIGAVIAAYQEIAPLKLGELWAVPIMLRLALIENIRRIAMEASRSRADRENARRWTDELISVEEKDPKSLVLAIADMARAAPDLSGAFVAEFKRRLQGRGSGMKLPLQWVEQNLNERGSSVEQTVSDENHDQAVLEISMRNCINSLRGLNVADWNDFVETMSAVEQQLRKDPAGVYMNMDFATRDDYRRAVEKLAKKSCGSEPEAAAACLELAREAALAKGASDQSAHVGYYLIGRGEARLRRTVGCRGGIGDFLRDASTRFTLLLYLGAIFILTVAFTAVTVIVARAGGVHGGMLVLLTALLAFATCHLAVALVNFVATQLVHPRTLPRLDFSKGIPASARTMVVVPVVVSGKKAVGGMLRTLETHYLKNRGLHIHFALLTDFPDAPTETMPGDDRLLNLCRLGVMKLNDKYRDDGGDNFILFHRPRKWNPVEGVWMAWERKRGKLEDLNRYLRGEDLDAFSCIEGRTDTLSKVRYVITLDADTGLPRDAAWQMVGAMAHPLVRPVYDERLGRVVSGHGILQPRVDATPSGANRSRYSRMCASEVGVDPYTRASSDVYQDLFDEGSFIGKGIYDVEMFDRALGRRFPDNKILSHDLIEGCVIRSGLLNDVKLYEDPPRSYLMDVFRRHRWIRGDWQIASYLICREFRDGKKADTTPLSLLSQWKIADNLRRSVTSIFLFLLLVLGLTVFTNPPLYLAVVVCVFLVPVVVMGLFGLIHKSSEKTLGQHVRNTGQATLRHAVQVFFKLACLPYEAYVSGDAIVRSLWRQCVSRRHLLQWNPSDNSHNENLTRFMPILGRMWMGPLAAVVMSVVLAMKNPGLLLYASPLFVLWLLSPLFACWLSRPRKRRRERLSDSQQLFLRRQARRIWLFFEDFVNAGENWLPPDNYQEYPVARTAHRTSPTNMGLALLANLSALDFGFITPRLLLYRTGKTLDTMSRMPRHRGHFYNWYDTLTLEVLRPSYVSTVDSGNLASHLLVLASGLRDLAAGQIIDARLFLGMRDTLDLAALGTETRGAPQPARLEPVRRLVAEAVASPPQTLSDFHKRLTAIAEAFRDAEVGATENKRWLEAFGRQCREAIEDLEELAPWAGRLAENADWAAFKELWKVPSLLDAAYLDERMHAADGEAALPGGLRDLLASGAENARQRLAILQKLLVQCEEMSDLDYEFLYDKSKRLLAIGFNADDNRLDSGFYDLLASEARLAVYLGIARNKIPQSSWFALGRLLTLAGRHPLLVSWSGSMFEYLMPLLVMPTFEDTLLDETYQACVNIQMDYGRSRSVPWGISESGYNVFDSERNYQYRAFGVPELGLRHALSDDLVIAPYATALAAMVYPERATRNMERMAERGFGSMYGFYEAIDYTASRLPRGVDHAVIRSFMAHHQGMSLVALGQTLLGRPMHRRFESNPVLQSAALLLQEMAPAERAMYYHSTYSPEIRPQTVAEEAPMRIINNPDTAHPEVQLLSNGNYHVMVTAAGGGYSRWRNLSLTRWREDTTKDDWGSFCYIRDHETGSVWSNTYQPTRQQARSFEAVFSEGRAEFNRRDGDFDCHTEIVVAPEDDVEVRRLRISNRSPRRRVIDVTSFAEVVLAAQAADDSHQAFSKLFIQTRIVPERQALVCSRRPSGPGKHTPFLFHMLAVRGTGGGDVSYESDRLRFLGRGNSACEPAALMGEPESLSGSSGAVLDPVVAIRSDITLEPGETVVVDIATGVAESDASLDSLLEKYQDEQSANKAFDMARTHGQVLLRQLNVSEGEAQRFTRLASSVVYANPALRADPGTILRNRRGQPGLWGYSLSGDLPIVLLKIADPSRIELVDQMIRAHAYWRQKGLLVDLMIWNEDETGYRQNLHDQIADLAGAALDDANMEQPGGIFIRPGERISEEDRTLIETVARVVLSDADGMLDEQMRKLSKSETAASYAVAQYRGPEASPDEPDPVPVEELVHANGYGGFTPDGREYVMETGDGVSTPLPWVNVMANAGFGCVVSESGSTYTWSENAREHRLTPWSNDPVSDPSGEAIYLRDEETGDFWSPTPHPCGSGQYVTRHGFGYSVFLHNAYGIHSRLTIHVDKDAAVKFFTLALANNSNRRRSLSATGYVEWVLGDLRAKTAMHVATGIDSRTGAIFARNRYNDDFRGRTAFLDVDEPGRAVCGDRREFLGRNGSTADPAAMRRPSLSGWLGPGLDPCAAAQIRFALAPGQEREIVFRLGIGQNVDEARTLVKQFHGLAAAHASLKRVRDFWRDTLGAIQVETPDTAFNFMVNGWLLYQTLSCRFWGRSATYQSGGAFGFRDQLQDTMALLYAEPALVRKHLLKCASRQFPEGDVQHWWHPPAGRGVRTQCSDDYLWLPYGVERYISVTGDTGVLDERAPYIDGRALREGEESYYDLPRRSEETDTLYEHCRRSLGHGMRFGAHGLPLIGSGDWNDGMDNIGRGGKGESVWLGFFLHTVLERFAGLATARGDDAFAATCMNTAAELARNIETHAWDNAWYRRAYFDDGTPLGSALNDECRIDSIVQSWSVMSGVGSNERSRLGMTALDEHLVDRDNMVVKLFEPPFDDGVLDPGYIKGYVPGVRENGGQYTHGAIWAGMAFAALGDREKTWDLQRLLNPVNHSLTAAWAEKYMVEPYVVSADVYANPQHCGRGGWSWYTGSSAWLYRFMLESILGFTLANGTIRLSPCVPADWKEFGIRFRWRNASYDIRVNNVQGVDAAPTVTVDGVAHGEAGIRIFEDSKVHKVEIQM